MPTSPSVFGQLSSVTLPKTVTGLKLTVTYVISCCISARTRPRNPPLLFWVGCDRSASKQRRRSSTLRSMRARSMWKSTNSSTSFPPPDGTLIIADLRLVWLIRPLFLRFAFPFRLTTRPYCILSDSAMEDFKHLTSHPIEESDSVVVGLAPERLDYEHLNTAFGICDSHSCNRCPSS
jgi:hypothetical protein